MRILLFLFLIFSIVKVSGQSFVPYKDTINHFSIQIPAGWTHGVNKDYPSILLIAYRTPVYKTDTSRDNFNINVIKTPNKSLDKSFADFMKYLPTDNTFKVISTGDTTFNGVKFKWLIETHKNSNNQIQMHNYDFVTVKNEKTYILTMVTFSYAFDDVKPMFDKIASSFQLID